MAVSARGWAREGRAGTEGLSQSWSEGSWLNLHARGSAVKRLLESSAPSALDAGQAARAGQPEVRPRRSRVFRRSAARAVPAPSHSSFRSSGRSPRPWAASTASPPGAMAAAAGDGAVKPLQCAMKLANGAIELDTGNRPRVRRGAARRGEAGPAPTRGRLSGRGQGRGRGVGAGRTPGGCGAPGAVSASDLGQLPGLSALFSLLFS